MVTPLATIVRFLLASGVWAWFSTTLLFAEAVPTVPVGADAFLRFDLWPQQRIGVRAYMRGTYDRGGGNEGADASHFLYQRRDDFNVTLDVEGRGVLYFARYNHWHGCPWHYVVDGRDNIVSESSSADPEHPLDGSVFLPTHAFPQPLTLTWAETKGADLTWVPIGFTHSFQMAYSRTHYGTGYYIYDQFLPGIPLSRRIKAWTSNTAPDPRVLALLGKSGSDLCPANARRTEGTVVLWPGAQAAIQITNAPAMLRALEFSAPRAFAIPFGRARLRIFWDDRRFPSVDAPVALFFGAGTLYNRDNREYLVKAFPVNIRFDPERVHLCCFFPMPFFKSARVELESSKGEGISDIRYKLAWVPCKTPPNQLAYFHATYADSPHPPAGKDLVLLDTRDAEGGGDWSGQFIGNSWIFSDRANLSTLEGDPRFFFDDSESPQGQGTGTEEWGGGGDYWGGRNMTLPFVGHPVGARNEKAASNSEDKIESAYRFLLADLMPFGRNARIQLEHGGENQSTEHYQAVTYWYGLPAPSLLRTDELQIGDLKSETCHHYYSPEASAPYEIVSRYDLGVDTLAGREIFPAHREFGRRTRGTSEFTLAIDSQNVGVMLRRTLDCQFPNQRAEVFIADAHARSPKWERAGTWYLAGGNTCVYSNPKSESGSTEHKVETSNRRFRDDEFLIPRKLTKGRSAIGVRIRFTPVNRPLFPGAAVPELAWSEIRYKAYSFVLPRF
ncbi:MAG TPA: DUF2961 domain-containing protein [Verrucomicrobiae bacterium]|nr:DUF2961 domain-containing protein [Verrucomicrobiae bacterium]